MLPWMPLLARTYGLLPPDIDLLTVAEARMFIADLTRKPDPEEED